MHHFILRKPLWDFKRARRLGLGVFVLLLVAFVGLHLWRHFMKENQIVVSPGIRLQIVNPNGEPVTGCRVEQEWGDSNYPSADYVDSAVSDSRGCVELPPRFLKVSAVEKTLGPSIQLLEGMGHANPGGVYSVIAISSHENKFCELFLQQDYLGAQAIETQTSDGYLGRRVVLQPKDVNDWIEVGNLTKVEQILERDGPIALTVFDNGHTPLDNAVRRGDLKLAQFLLERGGDVNVRNAYGATPIHYVNGIGIRWKEMIELLVEHGADVNAKDDDGKTPLQRAILGKHKAFLRRLGAR